MAIWEKVGAILSRKDGKGVYIKISTRRADKTLVLKDGQTLMVFDPRKNPKLSDEKKAKIPDFLKAEILLPPPQDKKED